MESSGPSSRHKKPCSFTLSYGPLDTIEQHKIIRELPSSMPRIWDIWIPIEIEVEPYCIHFYKLELDHKIWVRDQIIRTMFLGKDAHILCWRLSKGLNGN
jgi:hypothetical protein